ncbi:hypothetical protein SAMN06297387_108107 [Streptomyces zhaozhouensis]|uniref:Uncharacterized protein n=1 Tax=Streptomyces zhaozhouensis TaxID=1300267 RepID=A0A286DWL0_9ACTN|nr:hypothetical protein [Streptomyces zhaozhouensis]SOD62944.1 hypothetical protein SAMN06297387_108107 [Streptomyces zhaozhouensis]
MGAAGELRKSLLYIDGETMLPLAYTYEPAEGGFRTLGMVRVGGTVLMRTVRQPGPDTATVRVEFLTRVLEALYVAPGAAVRIARGADHVRADGTLEPRPLVPPGTRLFPAGTVPALLVGLLVGGWVVGWYGAVVGAYVGAATLPDLARCAWQTARARRGRGVVLVPEAVAGLLIAAGSLAGALIGCLTADEGADRVRGVFLGMAVAALVLSLVATRFSMVPLRHRTGAWLGPLVVGAQAMVTHAVWADPAGLACGVGMGMLLAAGLTAVLTERQGTPSG